MKQIQYINMTGGFILSVGLLTNIDSVVRYQCDFIQSTLTIQIANTENSDAAKKHYDLAKQYIDLAKKETDALVPSLILTGLGSVLICLRE